MNDDPAAPNYPKCQRCGVPAKPGSYCAGVGLSVEVHPELPAAAATDQKYPICDRCGRPAMPETPCYTSTDMGGSLSTHPDIPAVPSKTKPRYLTLSEATAVLDDALKKRELAAQSLRNMRYAVTENEKILRERTQEVSAAEQRVRDALDIPLDDEAP